MPTLLKRPIFARPICRKLRAAIHKADPDVIEDWKWGPNFYKNGMVCNFGAFKQHVGLWFFHGSSMRDPKRLFAKEKVAPRNMRKINFTTLRDVNEDALISYVKEAVRVNEEASPERTRQTTISIPRDLQSVLNKKTREFFDSLSYTDRKEYVRWIETAKKRRDKASETEQDGSDVGKEDKIPVKGNPRFSIRNPQIHSMRTIYSSPRFQVFQEIFGILYGVILGAIFSAFLKKKPAVTSCHCPSAELSFRAPGRSRMITLKATTCLTALSFFLLPYSGCSRINDAAEPRAVITVFVHFNDTPVAGKRVELLQTGEVMRTNDAGVSEFYVLPGAYTIRVYDLTGPGPALRIVEVAAGQSRLIKVFDCLPCV